MLLQFLPATRRIWSEFFIFLSRTVRRCTEHLRQWTFRYNFAKCWAILKTLSKQTQQYICSKVMVKRPATSTWRFYTTLWCIFNHNRAYMFQVVAVFLTLIFHKIVQRRVWVIVGYFIIALLKIYCWVCPWKNLENRSAFDKEAKNVVAPFLPRDAAMLPRSWES